MKTGTSFFASQPMFVLDQQSLDILDVNERAVELYGYTQDEFTSMNIRELGQMGQGDDLNEKTVHKVSSTDKIWTHFTKEGQKLYIQFTQHQFNLEGEKVYLTVAHNVSEWVEKEEHRIKLPKLSAFKSENTLAEIEWETNLNVRHWSKNLKEMFDTNDKEHIKRFQASVESFQNLFNSITDAIYIQGAEGKILEVNDGAVEMYGYERDDIIGKDPGFLSAPGKVYLDESYKYFDKALLGEPQKFEWWGQRKNGEVFPKEILSNPGTFFGKDVVINIARDIGERYEAEEQLRKSEEMFRQLFKNAPMPIVFMDKRQEIKQINGAFRNIFGYSINEINGINIDKLLVPEDRKEMAHKISKSVINGNTAHHFSKRLCKDGSLVDVLIYGLPVMVDGKTVAIFVIYVDITDRRQAEEQVKKSLKEKEVLLAEIHHRVKNNLAVITGLLELQSYNTSSKEAQKVLQASQMRINSIALIHEKLYQNENLSEISFDVYLEQLVQVIVSSLHTEETQISVNINADPVELTVNQAIPCGLILNELITNAHKHAFPDQDNGSIEILLQKEDTEVVLCVRDNGIGIDEDIDFAKPKSLGLTLIKTLSKQLKADFSVKASNRGTKFCLTFEIDF